MPRILGPLAALLVAVEALGGVVFSVKFDPAVRAEPASGRLIVFLIKDGAKVGGEPINGPFWDDPQPMFGMDIKGLAPGAAARVDDTATSFPDAPSRLSAGTYRAQARLDISRTNSNLRREAGNLSSKVVTFTVKDGATAEQVVEIVLDQATAPRAPAGTPGVEFVEVKSGLLSDFHKREVMLRAGVALPADYDAKKKYAAVYEVPGFGGDHSGAARAVRRRGRNAEGSPEEQLAAGVFWITLDPESPNGHTLFADSVNNGPCGRALVEELIPAIEGKYPLVARPEARLLRGHSSGGWSTLWLALNYPQTFGACWSSAPDPVDFRRFQLPDIYSGASMYHGADGKDLPSIRGKGGPGMTIRQENLMEEVLGPGNTSAQQWDSWLAVWGPRGADGHPAALYDPVTGAIDRAIAEKFRAYDLTELLKKNQGTMGLVWHQRIRLVVGDQDTFYLNEAVALLKTEVERLSFLHYPEGQHGYIKIVPGYDHGSVYGSPELKGFAGDMLEHLRRQGLVPGPE